MRTIGMRRTGMLGAALAALGLLGACASDRSEEHTSELQSRRYLHSFPTRRSSDLRKKRRLKYADYRNAADRNAWRSPGSARVSGGLRQRSQKYRSRSEQRRVGKE